MNLARITKVIAITLQVYESDRDEAQRSAYAIAMTCHDAQDAIAMNSASRESDHDDSASNSDRDVFSFRESPNAIAMNCLQTAKAIVTICKLERATAKHRHVSQLRSRYNSRTCKEASARHLSYLARASA